MTEKRKASISAATLTEAEMDKAAGSASDPTSNFNTFERQTQGAIEGILPQGEGNAISTRELLKIAGLPCVRQLQAQIEQERLHGALILSTVRNGGGYFLPSDGPEGEREINAFVQTLQARALNTLRTLRAAKQALNHLDGQMTIGG